MFTKLWNVLNTGAVHVWNQLKNGNIFPTIITLVHGVVGAGVGAVTPVVQTILSNALTGHPITLAAAIATVATAGVPVMVSTALGLLLGLMQHSPNLVTQKLAESVPPSRVNDAAAYIDEVILNEVKKLNPPAPPASGAKTGAGMVLLLAGSLFALASGAHAQDSIYRYNGGLNISQEAVTAKINGDFLCLGVQGGLVPLTLSNGTVSWNSANPIMTLEYLFVKGSVSPSASGVQVNAGWWVGPIFGAGEFQVANSNIEVAHGIVGATEGANLGLGNLGISEAYDLDTKAFYFGPSLSAGFDLGGFSITQVH